MTAFILTLALLSQGAPGRGAAAAGVVTGQIQTQDGKPATAVRVAAIPAPPPGVRPQDGIQYYVAPPPVRITQTDDEGRYRLANIPPGRYLIAAGLVGLATYYPGQIDALLASVVTVTADTPSTIDFKLVTPLGGRVSGRVTPPPAPNSNEIAVLSGVTLAEVSEVPVSANGQFAFGRVPPGRYLVSLFPTPPGFGSLTVDVREADVAALTITRPPVHTVSGRVVTSSGPIPNGLLALVTDKSYVPIPINPDGTFTVRAHSAQHRFDFGGLPSGYSVSSVRAGNRDVSNGLTVANADIPDVVVTVGAPRGLPNIRGTITGLTKPASVEMRGPIVGALKTALKADGSFEFPAATPGLYYLRVPEVPELGTTHVVVGWDGANVQLKLK